MTKTSADEFVLPLEEVPEKTLGSLRMRLLPLRHDELPVSVLHEELPPYTQTPTIYHKTTFEVAIVLQGQGIAYLDDASIRIRKGDIIRIPAGIVHRFETEGRAMRALSLFSPPLSDAQPDVHVIQQDIEVTLS